MSISLKSFARMTRAISETNYDKAEGRSITFPFNDLDRNKTKELLFNY